MNWRDGRKIPESDGEEGKESGRGGGEGSPRIALKNDAFETKESSSGVLLRTKSEMKARLTSFSTLSSQPEPAQSSLDVVSSHKQTKQRKKVASVSPSLID